jgi:pimeloyl-ACP methyl ester carboxylesterase/enamine deaminase RidA (YjgF/YER057c/UK114 family)
VPYPDKSIATSTHLIERGDRKVAFHDTPGGLPVILLDAGGGLDSSYWTKLLPELSKRTGSRIISYDRPGFGASDYVPGPWDSGSATSDLQAGLEALGATRDLILVSHSIGGEIAAGLAQRRPEWISGVVLVDANVPDFFTDDVVTALALTFEPIVAETKAAPETPQNRQFLAVAESFSERSRAFNKVSWPTTFPIINILAEKTPFNDAVPPAQWWRDGQARFASGAVNRRLVVAEGSSHDIVVDRPDVILRAIDDITSWTRPDAYKRLAALAIVLPSVASPAAAFASYVRTGNLIYVSGHIAKRDGKPWVGQLGRDMTTAEAKQAARSVAIDLLGALHAATENLNRVVRIVKVMSLVNSTPEFVEQHLVTNGCSELLVEVLGENGMHARSAFGVAQLPMGACVEIELVAEVRQGHPYIGLAQV